MPDRNQTEPNSARVIAISSGKGGVGKSTLASNLGIALTHSGKKVCLFDADTNLANINILLGISPQQTLEQFFNDDLLINDILTKGPGGIDIICGASGISDFIHFSPPQQKKLTQGLHTLEQNYDYLLIDTAAGIDETNISLILAAPYLLIIITREPTSLTDAFALLRVLKKQGFQHPVLVIVNMTKNKQSAQAIFKRFKMAVTQYLQLKQIYFAGYVLMDKNIPTSIVKQHSILLEYPDSPASQCIHTICERLLTSFNNSKQSHRAFSDYFADLSFFEAPEQVIQEGHWSPPTESLIDKDTQLKSELKNELRTKEPQGKNQIEAGLLQASYYARLLGQKR